MTGHQQSSRRGFWHKERIDVGDLNVDNELTLVGDGRVYNHIRIAAPQFKPGATAPGDGTEGLFRTLDFSNDREESAYFTLLVPFRVEEGSEIGAEIDWCHALGADAGKVRWGIEYIFIMAGETVDGTTATTEVTTVGSHTSGKLVSTSLITNLTGTVAHDALGIRIFRNHDHAGDTLGGDCKLIKIHLHFISDRLGESVA